VEVVVSIAAVAGEVEGGEHAGEESDGAEVMESGGDDDSTHAAAADFGDITPPPPPPSTFSLLPSPYRT